MTLPQILIVQSQPAAEAATAILGLPAHAAVGLDWATLAGRRVILWPTNTALSMAAFRANANACWRHGAEQVKLITPGPLDPAGWDAAAALADRWEKEEMLDWMRGRASQLEAPARDQRQIDPSPAPASAAVSRPERAEPATLDGPLEEVWATLGLEVNKGHPVANEDAVMRVLERHPAWADAIWYDAFLGRIMTIDGDSDREWSDADDGHLMKFLQRDLKIGSVRLNHVRTAIITHAFTNLRNCVQEWLGSLEWDGTERISHFFPDFCGTPDTAYARAVGRNFWLTMVARALRPGCKVDNMIVLEGKQGDGKSSMLEALAGKPWFTVQHESVTGKGFFEVLQGKLLVEIAEMDAFGKAEVTRVKQVVSTPSDRYREAYGRYAKDHPRMSVFAGTTNKDDWNRDETGARRFWPIKVEQAIDIPAVTAAREQLFAEAVMAYHAGEKWWVTPEAETLAEQEARREDDPWCTALTDWMSEIYKEEASISEVLWGALRMQIPDQSVPNMKRMGGVLRRFGWTNKHTSKGNIWVRPKNEPK